jgi:hypothetical protein
VIYLTTRFGLYHDPRYTIRFDTMLRIFLIIALALQINAQRGGYGGGGYRDAADGDWGENEEPPAQMVTQTQVQTQIQTKVQTQVQTQIRTMVSTAPTTVVQVQATTIVKVATILASSPVSSPPISSPLAAVSPSLSPSPSPSSPEPNPGPNQSQSPLQQPSEGALTVNDPSSVPSATTPSAEGASKPIGAAAEVSAPITSFTGTVATLKSGMEFRTTGIPNLGDGAEGVVYGHVRPFSLSGIGADI